MNPIEKQRAAREAVWEKQRAREEAKKPKIEKDDGIEEASKKPKLATMQEIEEQIVAERQQRAEEQRRAANGVPLGTIQREIVAFLRGAHRDVTLEELSTVAQIPIASNPDLLASINNHVKIQKSPSGLYRYKPKYSVSNQKDLLELIEGSDEGVIVKELCESYHDAAVDIEKLKKEGKVFAQPNKILGSEILFGCYSKYDLEIPPTLKDAWHAIGIPDATKLAAKLMELKLPVAVAPAAPKPKITRKKQKKVAAKGAGRVNDHFNHHVPATYRDDSWKDTLSLEQQMYGKNG